jgi:hypothetical protein
LFLFVVHLTPVTYFVTGSMTAGANTIFLLANTLAGIRN